MVFVSTWHPLLKFLPSILKKNFHLIENDPTLSQIFSTKPTVAFRKMKTIRNHVVKNDILPSLRTVAGKTEPCGSCQFCKNIFQGTFITNTNENISVKLTAAGTCKTKELVYAAICKKHSKIYVGHTEEMLKTRFQNINMIF